MPKVQPFNKLTKLSKQQLIRFLLIVLIGIVGISTLIFTQAATYSVSTEPEAGALSGNARRVTDTSSSGGSFIKFGSNLIINPKLSSNASKVLDYLQTIEGKYILSGQEENNSDLLEQNKILSLTEKKPALRSFELRADSISPIAEMIKTWNDGQLVSAQYHMGAPLFTDSFSNSQKEASIEKALTPGTPENKDFMVKLDWQADRLKQLKDNGVPVIWRPFHEMTGEWFWWGPNKTNGNDATQLKRLWIFTYNYYTIDKKLDNLIWNWNISSYRWVDSNWQSYYPGDEYVDMLSMDEYANHYNPDLNQAQFTANTINSLNKLKTQVSSNKMVTIGENGLLPDIDQLFAVSTAKPLYFLTWWNCLPDPSPGPYYPLCNSEQLIKNAYSHPKTITADELPSFK